MQWFTRRTGRTIVVGVDKALSMLRQCTGYWDGKKFVNTADKLEVWAVHDGCMVESDGNPLNVEPVLKVHGRYRDFAILETPTLGILARASRGRNKCLRYHPGCTWQTDDVLPGPALTCMKCRQPTGMPIILLSSATIWDYAGTLGPYVSTDAQGDWWGGAGGGDCGACRHCGFPG